MKTAKEILNIYGKSSQFFRCDRKYFLFTVFTEDAGETGIEIGHFEAKKAVELHHALMNNGISHQCEKLDRTGFPWSEPQLSF